MPGLEACAPAYLQTAALGSAGLLKRVKVSGPVFGRLLFSSFSSCFSLVFITPELVASFKGLELC